MQVLVVTGDILNDEDEYDGVYLWRDEARKADAKVERIQCRWTNSSVFAVSNRYDESNEGQIGNWKEQYDFKNTEVEQLGSCPKTVSKRPRPFLKVITYLCSKKEKSFVVVRDCSEPPVIRITC